MSGLLSKEKFKALADEQKALVAHVLDKKGVLKKKVDPAHKARWDEIDRIAKAHYDALAQMPFADFLQYRTGSSRTAGSMHHQEQVIHKNIIRQALDRGTKIPDKVLNEYSDLKPQVEKESPEQLRRRLQRFARKYGG